MSAPAPLNLDVYRGDDEVETITFNIKVNNVCTPEDITGRTYRAQLRRVPEQPTVDAFYTCTVPVGTDGKVVMTMSAAQSASLDPNTHYYWDLEENASGVITTRCAGKVFVTGDVTR